MAKNKTKELKDITPEDDIVEEKKSKKAKLVGKLGGYDIIKTEDVEVSGKSLVRVYLSDGSATIMSESDIKNQLKA